MLLYAADCHAESIAMGATPQKDSSAAQQLETTTNGLVAKSKKTAVSKSKRSGLTLPIARFNRYMKTKSGLKRVAAGAPVYLTAVVEYLAGEMLESAGTMARDRSRKTITDEDLKSALRKDPDLARLFAGMAMFTGTNLKNVTKLIELKQRPAKAAAA